jgi:hypothetical protein
MASDVLGEMHSAPVAGVAVVSDSGLQIFFADRKLMTFPGLYHYSSFAVLHQLACNQTVKEAVPQAVQNDFLEAGKHRVAFVEVG